MAPTSSHRAILSQRCHITMGRLRGSPAAKHRGRATLYTRGRQHFGPRDRFSWKTTFPQIDGVGLRVVAVVGERGGILDSAQCITQVNRPRLLRLGAQTAMLLWLPGLVVRWRVTQTSECGPRALPEHAALSWPLGMAQTKEEKHPVLTLRGPHSGERNNLAFTVWPARGWSPTYITFT